MVITKHKVSGANSIARRSILPCHDNKVVGISLFGGGGGSGGGDETTKRA